MFLILHAAVAWTPPPLLMASERHATRTILFDADGTLLDSLPPHINFCHTLNKELGLRLSLPLADDVDACRQIAAAPMEAFFRAAGFPEAVIAESVAAYEQRFAVECPVAPFVGVDALLSRLIASGARCAIISSNTAFNVRKGLGSELSARFEFVDGIDNAPDDKADAIRDALAKLGVEADTAVYVGDTRKDCVKATEAGVPFVGVDYGFEALLSDRAALGGALVAVSVVELEQLLLEDH